MNDDEMDFSWVTDSGQEGGAGGETSEEVVEAAEGAVEAVEESLLSPEELQRLTLMEGTLPTAFLQTNAHQMRSMDAIVDFATTVCIELANENMKPRTSAEIRRWAELMYTCILAGKNGMQNNTQVNYVGQLIQLAGITPDENGQPDKQVIEVQDAIRGKGVPRKKAQGE